MSIVPPDDAAMVGIVNNITATMLNLEARLLKAGTVDASSLLHCSAVLPMPGPAPITVGVSSDLAGCQRLGAALFAVDLVDVDNEMVDDTLKELANMVAGQIKGLLDLAQNLGLPRVFNSGEFAPTLNEEVWHHILVGAGEATVLLSLSMDAAVVGHYV